jgi:phosphatidylglycerophosphate synthase
MKLHRIEGKPEWAAVAQQRRDYWQRVAARTGGVVTPGNFFTVSGFALAAVGLWAIADGQYWAGLALLLVGRFFDIVDGAVADWTGTKSPLGELLDAGFDKLITIAALIVLFAAHLAPWFVVLGLVLPHLIIAFLAGIAASRGKRLHPSLLGKLSMALVWGGLSGLVLLHALDIVETTVAVAAVYTFIVASIILGLGALAGYVKAARA